METATWVIAAASVVNLTVLAAYAWYTRGILEATRQGTLRTEELVRQSRDALKLQILVAILEGEHPLLEAAGIPRKWTALWRRKGDEVRALLEAAFPALWQEIVKNLQDAVETVQLEAEAEGDPHPTQWSS
jgi:hypothetical protein